MKTYNDSPEKKKVKSESFADPFPNAGKKSAAEVNNAGSANSRNYNNQSDAGAEGPDFNKKSKGVDGDTGQNAGVFK